MVERKSGPKLSHFDYIFAGGASGCITRMTCQPLDVLKIRLQLQVEPISQIATSKYKSVIQATQVIIKEEGIKALWKGHIPAQLLSISYGVTQFWTFETLSACSSELHSRKYMQPLANFTYGTVAGCAATFISFPFDVVRTRLVAQDESQRLYFSVTNALKTIVQSEGLLVLYRGLLPTFIQMGPHAGIQFMCYKLFQKIYLQIANLERPSMISSLLSGSLAGLCAKTVVYPMDLVKKRMQIQGFEKGRNNNFGKFFICNGMYDCLVRIYKYEGFLGLFKGLSPSLIKAVCTTGLHFCSYEMIRKLLENRNF